MKKGYIIIGTISVLIIGAALFLGYLYLQNEKAKMEIEQKKIEAEIEEKKKEEEKKKWLTGDKIVDACRDAISKRLKDPYSVQWWEFEKVENVMDGIQIIAVKQSYNSKNSYGAYAWFSSAYCNKIWASRVEYDESEGWFFQMQKMWVKSTKEAINIVKDMQ